MGLIWYRYLIKRNEASLRKESLARKLADDYAVCNDVYTDIQVSCNELSSAIDCLRLDKACGLDGIYAEHLKFGSCLLADLLSQCMSSLFTHGSLPDSMIVLVPVIK